VSLIEVNNVSKQYRQKVRKSGVAGALYSLIKSEYETKNAVNNISFHIEQGEKVGYIGMNGAGKSTTIKMLVGILNPSSGEIIVNGMEPYKSRKKNAKNIGVVFGQRTQLWWDLPVSETLVLLKKIYNIEEAQFQKNMKIFEEVFGISQFINTPVRQLSLGQRIRSDICAAFLHNPSIIYLDEPTIGLDVLAKRQIQNFINEISENYGTTVMLTTHDMLDIERTCNRVIILDKGEIINDCSLEYLKENYSGASGMTVQVDQLLTGKEEINSNIVSKYSIEANKIEIQYKKGVSPMDVLNELATQFTIVDFTLKEDSLEELICQMYSRKG